MNLRSAVAKINSKSILLVFPLNNRKDIASLWSEFYPRSRMTWEWDENGDTRVADLWHLRERLSKSGQVIYSKWFRGRATLISRELFPALLRALNPDFPEILGLSFVAREILDLLDEDSPLSTKQLKRVSGLQGRENESSYQRALKELWSRGLIVAFGEVDEGAFPSIAIGSTRLLFEDLWAQAADFSHEDAEKKIAQCMKLHPSFFKFFSLLKKSEMFRSENFTGT